MHKERLKTFLFDAFEGLSEIENWLKEEKEDHEKILRYADKTEGWLARGLYSRSAWVAEVFEWLTNQAKKEENETRCLILSKISELLQISPYAEWMGDYLKKQCEEMTNIPNGQSKSWLFGEICRTLNLIGNKEKTERSFLDLLESLQSMEEEEQARCCIYLADGLSGLNGVSDLNSWIISIHEKILENIRGLKKQEKIIETSISVHEKIFGYEYLKAELAYDPNVAIQSLRYLLSMNNNFIKWRGRYARRLFFASKEMAKKQSVSIELWNKGLEAFDELEDWFHEERNLIGEKLWSYSGKMLLLLLLQRDFANHNDRGWTFRYFKALLERIAELKERKEREEMLRRITMNLWANPKENEPMLSLLFLEGDKLVRDFSCVYEGLAQCEIEGKEWLQAERYTKRIKDKTVQDRLLKSILQGYIECSYAEKAVSLLRAFHQRKARKDAMMLCATSPVIGENPIACAMLCEEALVQDDAEEVFSQMLKNLGIKDEAKRALAKEGIKIDKKQMDAKTRKERLQELEYLEENIPIEVYKKRRKELIGLQDKEENKKRKNNQEGNKIEKIVIDKPQRYGADHDQTPKEHIKQNHFSKEIGGSLFTLWSNFETMWDDIEEYIDDAIAEEGKKEIYVIEKQFPLEVGLSKVIKLKEAPRNSIKIETRNGQACLVCNASERQEPTDWLTIIVGKSQKEPDEMEEYAEHTTRLTLYSAYPGRPSCPFPQCRTEKEKEELCIALKEVLNIIEKGALEDAKRAIDCAYQKMDGDKKWASYWSEHILLL